MEKNEPLISVIVPVYDVEKYLPKCLDSLLAQTWRNLEIIVVNDGSPDGSWDIMQDYAARDSRIRLRRQKTPTTTRPRRCMRHFTGRQQSTTLRWPCAASPM